MNNLAGLDAYEISVEHNVVPDEPEMNRETNNRHPNSDRLNRKDQI